MKKLIIIITLLLNATIVFAHDDAKEVIRKVREQQEIERQRCKIEELNLRLRYVEKILEKQEMILRRSNRR